MNTRLQFKPLTGTKRGIALLIMVAVVFTCTFVVVSCEAFAASKKPAQTKIVYTSSKAEGKIRMKWKIKSCDGYEVLAATNSKFTHNMKTTDVTAADSNILVWKNLISGKVYYLKVRTYTVKANGSKVYGNWSSVVKQYVYSADGRVTTKATCATGVRTYTDAKTGVVTATKIIPAKYAHTIATSSKVKKKSTKGKKAVKSVRYTYTCADCGQSLTKITNTLEDGNTVTYVAPANTRSGNGGETTNPSVTNSAGFTYNYKLYRQNTSSLYYTYPEYSNYIRDHGCSTAALTAVLNATVPALANYTPDMVIEKVEKKVFGTSVVKKNFNKSLKKQMPVNLKGMSKILSYYGVKNTPVYKYSNRDMVTEITQHLQEGNPVIITLPSSNSYAGGIHTMVMLGLDENGKVIMGDSLKQSSSKWGSSNGLVKFDWTSGKNINTVESIVKCIKKYSSTKSSWNSLGMYFSGSYKGDIGYILVN